MQSRCIVQFVHQITFTKFCKARFINENSSIKLISRGLQGNLNKVSMTFMNELTLLRFEKHQYIFEWPQIRKQYVEIGIDFYAQTQQNK